MGAETAKWHAIINAVVDAVILIDEAGRIEEANPAAYRMFDYTSEELIGQNISILMPEPYRSKHDQYLRHYHETGTRQIIGIGREVYGQRKDGVIFPVRLSVGEAQYGDRHRFVGVIHDLTETKRNEENLRQAQKAEIVAQLTAGVAHDFNNLLNVIQGNLEMAEQYINHPEGLAILADVLGAIDDSSQFIKRLLAYGRGRMLRPESVDLNLLVRNLTVFARRILGTSVELHHDLDDDLPPVFVDPCQLEAALLNILLNAGDALEGQGDINISTCLDSSPGEDRGGMRFVRLDVDDNGHGMNAETLANVFDPFFTTKPVGLGSGLGLSMVQGFVKQSHGEIKISSRQGEGTTVSLLLPVAPELVDPSP